MSSSGGFHRFDRDRLRRSRAGIPPRENELQVRCHRNLVQTKKRPPALDLDQQMAGPAGARCPKTRQPVAALPPVWGNWGRPRFSLLCPVWTRAPGKPASAADTPESWEARAAIGSSAQIIPHSSSTLPARGGLNKRKAFVAKAVASCAASKKRSRGAGWAAPAKNCRAGLDLGRKDDKMIAHAGGEAQRRLSGANIAGWSSPVAREAHNLEVAGSNPVPATNDSGQVSPEPADSGRTPCTTRGSVVSWRLLSRRSFDIAARSVSEANSGPWSRLRFEATDG
jgi:hypothetical protein